MDDIYAGAIIAAILALLWWLTPLAAGWALAIWIVLTYLYANAWKYDRRDPL